MSHHKPFARCPSFAAWPASADRRVQLGSDSDSSDDTARATDASPRPAADRRPSGRHGDRQRSTDADRRHRRHDAGHRAGCPRGRGGARTSARWSRRPVTRSSSAWSTPKAPRASTSPRCARDTDLAVDFLNAHGGFGGRPIEIEHCTAAGSPETSQACAQELAGKGVEMVMLGLDLFPGYDTFTAAGIPVVGVLPILPGDYTANALFVTRRQLHHHGRDGGVRRRAASTRKTVGIISADNAGANGSEADLTEGVRQGRHHLRVVKGGDNETDAGIPGSDARGQRHDPDVLCRCTPMPAASGRCAAVWRSASRRR